MDDNTLEDLLRRLTTLVVKIDERDTQMTALLERHDIRIAQHDAMLDELRALNREQVRINQRLETLMTEVFHQRGNGREA